MTVTPEADAVEQAILDLRNEPPPSDVAGFGCTLAILIVVSVVLGMPVLVRATTLPNETIVIMALGLGMVAVSAGFLGVAGGRDPTAVMRESCERATDRLLAALAGPVDPAEAARHAVQILEHARVQRRDGEAWAYPPDDARDRLGDAWDYVIGAERILLDRGLLRPTFTDGLAP